MVISAYIFIHTLYTRRGHTDQIKISMSNIFGTNPLALEKVLNLRQLDSSILRFAALRSKLVLSKVHKSFSAKEVISIFGGFQWARKPNSSHNLPRIPHFSESFARFHFLEFSSLRYEFSREPCFILFSPLFWQKQPKTGFTWTVGHISA